MQNKSFFARVLHTVAAAALVSCVFTSCNKGLVDIEEDIHMPQPQEVKVHYDIHVDRDMQYGTAIITEITEYDDHVEKRDTSLSVALGNVEFFIDANDTVYVVNNNLEHKSFKLDDPKTEEYETNGVYYTRTTRTFTDYYDKYEKHGHIRYLDAYTYAWGQKVVFPAASGLVSYLSVSTTDKGTKGKYAYTLCTSEYETSFMGSKQSNEQGFYTLAVEQENKLISGPTKTDEGFEVIKYDDNGNPSVERSWIELTEIWSQTGEKKETYEVTLNSTVEAPAYDIKVLNTFTLEQINQTISQEVEAGTRKDANFTIVKRKRTQTVGNDKFTKDFHYYYEKATLNLNGKIFEMPFEVYQQVTDKSFTMETMSPMDGYDRQLNTHSVAATFAGKPVKAKAETEIRVPEAKDELVDTKITGEGFDYVNSTTSNAWIEITETWTKSGKKVYKKDVNLRNDIIAPAKVTKILDNFDLNQITAQLGAETLTNTRTMGDFTVKTYTRDYTVGNNKFQRVFKLTYEKATYNPLNHAMIWKGYENASDNGFTTADMSNITSGDKTYNRKSYEHGMSASFNDHEASRKAEAELWVETSNELKSRTITDEGFDYVNPTTSNAWIEITEVWSLEGIKKYKKSVNLTNGITAPEKITKILDSFNLTKVGAQLGNETKGSSRTDGDFTITTYTRNYTVGNDKFTRTFVLKYEKATYNPMSHAMISKAYENVSDGGFTLGNMSNTTSNGKTYERRSYAHDMSASFNGHDANSKAEAELWVETSDEMKSRTIVDEGFDYVNATTSKAWIKVKEVWSLSGTKEYTKSVNLTNGITAPEKITKILPSFQLSQIGAQLGNETKGSSRTDGDFTITTYTRNYTVGNDKFTRTFVLKYEKATYNPMSHAMISKAYENVQDGGFTTDDMSNTTSNGKTYLRKSYTHNMSARFNSHDASSKAEAELWVETTDEMKSRTIVDEGFDYVNATTSKAWIKVKEEWSLSGTKEYTKSVNLTNGITAPEKITKILPSFELSQIGAQLGSETKGSSRTDGDFTVTTYTRNYTVGNDKFTRTFVLKYEKATYKPMNHNMISKAYENVQDGGFTTGNMSNTTSNGKEYERKSYTHNMSASFNNHNANSKAEAELWVEKVEERETPHWLGNPVSAKYTRVQRKTGEQFMDMIVFTYQNGVVMAPNGKVDMNLIYAFSSSVANQHGVDVCLKDDSYSGVWTGSKWAPAGITVTNGRWIYAGKNASWDHTVMENNAITLGIGVDVTPIPKAQSYSISGNKITIKYAKNNGKTTADTSLDLR